MIINRYYSDVKRKLFEARKQFLKEYEIDVDLIFLGDSILQGFDINRFGGSNKYVFNSAIGGDFLDYMNKRFEEDVLYYNPREILFLGGINDIRKWYDESKTIEDIDYIKNYVVSKYTSVLDKCKKNNLKVHPCLIILSAEDKNNYPFLNIVIEEINKELKLYLKANKIEYIDFNNVLVNKYGFLSRDLTDDGLHPNDYGNFEMYKLLKEKKVL